MRPVDQRPVGLDRGEVLHRAGGLGCDDLVPLPEGEALDLPGVGRPVAIADGLGQRDHDLFALPTDDHINPGRLGQDLAEHEGGMNPAEDADGTRYAVGSKLQHILGGVDRRGDRGDADDVRPELHQTRTQVVGPDMHRHGVDEVDVVEALGLQAAGKIGHPGRRPVPGDLCPA